MNSFDVNEQSAGSSVIDVWQVEPSGETVSASHRGVISKVQKLDTTTKPRSPAKAERYCACCQEGIKMSFRDGKYEFSHWRCPAAPVCIPSCSCLSSGTGGAWGSQSCSLLRQKQTSHVRVKHTCTLIQAWASYMHQAHIHVSIDVDVIHACQHRYKYHTHQSTHACQVCIHVDADVDVIHVKRDTCVLTQTLP